MKKLFFNIIGIAVFALFTSSVVFAQGLGTNAVDSNGHTAREEAEGKIVWEKLQAKQITCSDLSSDNFGVLGEYFMGQMMGTSHEAMNNMMIQMMGEEGEEQMHVVMGKRLSGCDTSAAFPSQGIGFMPMMNMMGNWSNPSTLNSFNYPMMGYPMMNYSSFGSAGLWFNWIFMIFWWALIIFGIVALIRWITRQNGTKLEKSALDILKERYAKGEINRQEFEKMKEEIK